jgi:hypothetical protein
VPSKAVVAKGGVRVYRLLTSADHRFSLIGSNKRGKEMHMQRVREKIRETK